MTERKVVKKEMAEPVARKGICCGGHGFYSGIGHKGDNAMPSTTMASDCCPTLS
jgi:hypothetical protein